MYNTSRINSIDEQINLLQQQKATLMNYQPPIQQNFITQSKTYDFNGYWADNIEEAKKIPAENNSLIIIDKNEDRFYLRLSNGEFKAFDFNEVELEDTQNDDVASLKQAIDTLRREVEELKKGRENEQSI